ncbi:MAG TPA: metallophosphoesterase family protein [Rugosimonospora sp.]|nr:metallophosphoesterase family protein [Rugosimonospora sp.]
MAATDGVRVAAIADTHLRKPVAGTFRTAFKELGGQADLLLLAGDLTNGGTLEEIDILGREVQDIPVPAIAVLGNHDHDEGHGDLMRSTLEGAGVRVLEGDAMALDVAGVRVGIAGVMGGSGGFPGAGTYPAVDDGNPEHQARIRRGPEDARKLRAALDALDCDVPIALMHFSPVPDTLVGEPPQIYPGLGCHQLGAAVDGGGAHLAIHGHAHSGTENGQTPGGVPVRNVAYPVLRQPYAIYHLIHGQVLRL